MTSTKPPKADTERLKFKVSARKGLLRKDGKHRHKVADFIRLTGLAQEEGDERYLARLKFRTLDDDIKMYLMPRQDLHSPRTVIAALLDEGFRVPDDKRQKDMLIRYLCTTPPKRRFLVLNRTGWCGNVYVLPDGRLIGKPSGPKIIFRPADRQSGQMPPPVLGGTLEGWREGVAIPALHSRRMMFAIAVSFASMLLHLTDVESTLFHFFGASSIGKSISLLAALSVFSQAQKTKQISWDITANALEEIAAEHCDRLLVLDEAGLLFGIDPRKGVQAARDIAFKLTAGAGRRRSRFFTRGTKVTAWSWRLMVLSSGEDSFGAMAAKAGLDRLGGEKVRMIDVPAIMSEALGIFHSVPEGRSSAELAEQVEMASRTHFGHPACRFAKLLVAGMRQDRGALVRSIDEHREAFTAAAQVPSDSWEQRFAGRFGIAYAAACLAIDAAILPWTKKEALEAVVDTYQAARRAVPSFDEAIERAWNRVCDKLADSKRIADLAIRSGREDAKAGKVRAYLKDDPAHGRYFVVCPETLRRWVGDSVSPVCLGAWMRDHGHLVTTSRNLPTRQVKVSGIKGRRTYYCIRAKSVEEATC